MQGDAGPSALQALFREDAGHEDESVFSSSSEDDHSDEESLASQQRKRGAARRMEAVEGLYKGDSVLPTEEFGSLAVRDIHAMVQNKVINLSPDYQRDVVWPTDHVTGLIESLLRNMHVPELLFNIYTPLDSRDPWYRRIQPALQIRPEGRAALPEGWHFESDVDEGEGDEQRVVMQVWNCADGKQRMSAISKFIDNKVPVRGSDGKSYTYSNLPPAARAVFDSKRLRYGFFRELSDRQEREIFKRVQRGKALDKGEILNSVDSGYADWVRGLQTRYLGNMPDSLRPRVLQGARGQALTGAYQASRNIIVGVGQMKNETDLRRAQTLERDSPPSRADQDDVEVALRRFLDLTKVAPLEGEDRWPETQSYEELRLRGVPVPHRVWRLRPEMIPAKRNNKSKSKRTPDTVTFAPVELHILPAVVHHFRRLNDGDLLELVELLRVHIHDRLTGEVKDNSKTYDLVKAWIKGFKTSRLSHKYADSGAPTDRSRRLSTVASFAHLAPSASAASNPSTSAYRPRREAQPPASQASGSKKRSASAANGAVETGTGAGAGSAAKKARTASASTAAASRSSKGKGKEREREPAEDGQSSPARADANSSFGLPTRPSGSAASAPASAAVPGGIMPLGVLPPLRGDVVGGLYGGASPSTNGRRSTTALNDPLPSFTPAAPTLASGLSEKQRKYFGRIESTAAPPPPPPSSSRKRPSPPPPPAPAPAASHGDQPARRPPQSLAKRQGRPQYDERGREILAPPPSAASGANDSFRRGAGPLPPGFGVPDAGLGVYAAENDVSLSFVEDDEANDPYGGAGGGGGGSEYGVPRGGREPTAEQDEMLVAITKSQGRTGSGGAPGGYRIKGDPDEEDSRVVAALLGAGTGTASARRDDRDDEVMGLLAARQRGHSRGPPAGAPRERGGGGGGSGSRWDGFRVDRREPLRDDWRSALQGGGGSERRTSGGYEHPEDRRASNGYRRDEYRDHRHDERSQSRSRGYRHDQPPRPNGRGNPPSPSPPPARPPSSRLPANLPPQPRPNGSGYPPPPAPSSNGYSGPLPTVARDALHTANGYPLSWHGVDAGTQQPAPGPSGDPRRRPA